MCQILPFNIRIVKWTGHFVISRLAEGPGRDILKHPVRQSVTFRFRIVTLKTHCCISSKLCMYKYVHHVMGVYCIGFDIDGMLFEIVFEILKNALGCIPLAVVWPDSRYMATMGSTGGGDVSNFKCSSSRRVGGGRVSCQDSWDSAKCTITKDDEILNVLLIEEAFIRGRRLFISNLKGRMRLFEETFIWERRL